MPHIGWTEILVIVGVLVLLFGAKKIPELMRGLGRGAHEFKKGLKEGGEEPGAGPETTKSGDSEGKKKT